MDGHVHRILVIGLYVFALCVALMFGSLVFSLAFPSWDILTESQFDTLRDFLFSGGVGAAIAAAARRVTDGKGED